MECPQPPGFVLELAPGGTGKRRERLELHLPALVVPASSDAAVDEKGGEDVAAFDHRGLVLGWEHSRPVVVRQ